MRVKTHVKIRKILNRSGNPAWIVDMGVIDGNRKIRQFAQEKDAHKFAAQCNEKIQKKLLGSLGDLSDLSKDKHEILLAKKRLESSGASLLEAVDFYLKYANPPRGEITLQEAVDKFIKSKYRTRKSERYIKGLQKDYLILFLSKFKPSTLANKITIEQVDRYIYANTTWGNNTILNHARNLRWFYNFLKEEGFCSLNPFEKLKLPTKTVTASTPLSVENVQQLLNTALEHKYYDRLVCYVLVLFCGVRMEEAAKLGLENIDFEGGRVEVPMEVAKKRRHRINQIPQNAQAWLELCRPHLKEGKIVKGDYESKMKRVRQKSGIKYSQNACRHSFGSYHVALHKNAGETALMLGHVGDIVTLYNFYRHAVKDEEAKQFWNIYPQGYHEKKKQEEINRQVEFCKLNKLDFDVDDSWGEQTVWIFEFDQNGDKKGSSFAQYLQKNAEYFSPKWEEFCVKEKNKSFVR